jgi:hypothetical protein
MVKKHEEGIELENMEHEEEEKVSKELAVEVLGETKPEFVTVEEVSLDEFEKMKDGTGTRTILNYDRVLELVKGRPLSNKGLEMAVNKVRIEQGISKCRDLYWSEKKRLLKHFEQAGHKVRVKEGPIGNKMVKFYLVE